MFRGPLRILHLLTSHQILAIWFLLHILRGKRREVGNLFLWRSFFVGNMDTIMAYPQTLQTTATMARIARMGHAYTCFFPTIPNKTQPVSLRNALPINSPVSYVFDMFSFFCHSLHIFHICPSSFICFPYFSISITHVSILFQAFCHVLVRNCCHNESRTCWEKCVCRRFHRRHHGQFDHRES